MWIIKNPNSAPTVGVLPHHPFIPTIRCLDLRRYRHFSAWTDRRISSFLGAPFIREKPHILRIFARNPPIGVFQELPDAYLLRLPVDVPHFVFRWISDFAPSPIDKYPCISGAPLLLVVILASEFRLPPALPHFFLRGIITTCNSRLLSYRV